MRTCADFSRRSIADRDVFWGKQAELVGWRTPCDRDCDGTAQVPATRVCAAVLACAERYDVCLYC